MSGMIRVSRGFHQSAITTSASSRLGISDAPFASLRRSDLDDPLPSRGDYSPKKKKRKRAD